MTLTFYAINTQKTTLTVNSSPALKEFFPKRKCRYPGISHNRSFGSVLSKNSLKKKLIITYYRKFLSKLTVFLRKVPIFSLKTKSILLSG